MPGMHGRGRAVGCFIPGHNGLDNRRSAESACFGNGQGRRNNGCARMVAAEAQARPGASMASAVVPLTKAALLALALKPQPRTVADPERPQTFHVFDHLGHASFSSSRDP